MGLARVLLCSVSRRWRRRVPARRSPRRAGPGIAWPAALAVRPGGRDPSRPTPFARRQSGGAQQYPGANIEGIGQSGRGRRATFVAARLTRCSVVDAVLGELPRVSATPEPTHVCRHVRQNLRETRAEHPSAGIPKAIRLLGRTILFFVDVHPTRDAPWKRCGPGRRRERRPEPDHATPTNRSTGYAAIYQEPPPPETSRCGPAPRTLRRCPAAPRWRLPRGCRRGRRGGAPCVTPPPSTLATPRPSPPGSPPSPRRPPRSTTWRSTPPPARASAATPAASSAGACGGASTLSRSSSASWLRRLRRGCGVSAARLDLGDPEAVRRFFVDLRVTIDDAAGVTEDLLRPLRARDLGHREHRRL